MEPVDILFWIDALENGVLVNMPGQRELNQYPVNRVVFVEFSDLVHQFGLLDRAWERDLTTDDPEFLARPGFHSHIRRGCRVFTDENHGKTWMDAALFQFLNFSGNFCLDIFCDLCSVNKSSCHLLSS